MAVQQLQLLLRRGLHTSSRQLVNKKAGIPKANPNHKVMLNYEQGTPPYEIGVKKTWNSWNTSNLKDENEINASEILLDDIFIRKFMAGTWHNLLASEVTIKRRYNMINLTILSKRNTAPVKIYFLIGYTEELLGHWFKCPVKVEVSTVADEEDTFYKYV